MSEIEKVEAEIHDLITQRDALREQIAEVEAQRVEAATALAEAQELVVRATAALAEADAEIAAARVPLVAEVEDVQGALRVASSRHESLILAEAAEPSDGGDIVAPPGIESEEVLGKI
jgi:septal ring factor EnvC (AmiA/AmiB activator)